MAGKKNKQPFLNMEYISLKIISLLKNPLVFLSFMLYPLGSSYKNDLLNLKTAGPSFSHKGSSVFFHQGHKKEVIKDP